MVKNDLIKHQQHAAISKKVAAKHIFYLVSSKKKAPIKRVIQRLPPEKPISFSPLTTVGSIQDQNDQAMLTAESNIVSGE